MTNQIYYEDVAAGSEIPPLVKHPTTQQLVKWAGAVDDYNPIHYDKDFAQSRGLPGVIVHGALIASFLGQLLTDWIGKKGSVRKFSCQYRDMSVPDRNIVCKGEVTKKQIEDGEPFVECNLWAENPEGEKVVPATATVTLPHRL
jgi:acyl dehydratase